MAEIPRLNSVIRALEQGKTAFVGFGSVDIETAAALAASNLDGVAFEMEHAPMSAPALRDALQYMLDRRQILDSGTLAPKVTPMVRIPPNGGEMNQWIAKQVLDIGVFGIIFPHVITVEEARNAVSACRYPRLPQAPRYNPPGMRRALLGPLAAGVLRAGRRVAAGAAGRDPRDHPVRGHEGDREPSADAPGSAGHRRRADWGGGSEPGARPSARVRAPRRGRGDRSHLKDLQGPQRAVRPPASGREEHRAPDRERLPLPDAGHAAVVRSARAGAQARRPHLSGRGPQRPGPAPRTGRGLLGDRPRDR